MTIRVAFYSCPLVVAVMLIATVAPPSAAFEKAENMPLVRVKRHGASNPQLIPGPKGKLNVPIPTNIAVFGGASLLIDSCSRDEVQMENGTCQVLLMQGDCKVDEYVLLNPDTNLGYCASRLCPPDRIFIFSTQLCHDPREMNLCPPGREVYESSYGTPVCQCPDGTYESDDDLDDDVCEPLLGQASKCSHGEVFWFRDFNEGPECVADPCGGLNLNRGPNDLPFIPSIINGRCFQIGASDGVCPANTWYGLAIDTLKGVCEDLEEFGYNVFGAETLRTLVDSLGPPITRNNASPIPTQTTTGPTFPNTVHVVQQPIVQPQIFQSQPITTQSVVQIIKIQEQISLLQQQLTLLQQSLSNNIGKTHGTPTVQPSGVSHNFVIQNQRTNLGNPAPVTPVTVIRAKLESQYTHSPAPEVSHNTQIYAPQQKSVQNQQFTTSLPSTTNVISPNYQTPTQQHVFQSTNDSGRPGQSSARPGPFSVKIINSQPQSLPLTNINQGLTFKSINFPNQNQQHHFKSQNNNQQPPFSVSLKRQQQTETFRQQPVQQPNIQQQNNIPVRQYQQPINRVTQYQQPNTTVSQYQPQAPIPQYQQPNHPVPQYQQPNHPVPQYQQPNHPVRQYQQRKPSAHKKVNKKVEILLEPLEFIRIQSIVQQPEDNSLELYQRHSSTGHRRNAFNQRTESFDEDEDDIFDSLEDRRVKRSASSSSRKEEHLRRRRSPLPHASPSNVFESRLLGCRGGAVRDINSKCRRVILPPRIPKRRIRAAKPVRPRRSCTGAFNIFRRCTTVARAQSSLNLFALG